MFEVQIPSLFIVSDCSDCNSRHAPIRDCLSEIETEKEPVEYDREADYWYWSGSSR